jgi:hypothetical protein
VIYVIARVLLVQVLQVINVLTVYQVYLWMKVLNNVLYNVSRVFMQKIHIAKHAQQVVNHVLAKHYAHHV